MIHQADKELKKEFAQLFDNLPDEAKLALKSALQLLHTSALAKANHCWKKHKAPMALYWKVVGVYAGHINRAVKIQKNNHNELQFK